MVCSRKSNLGNGAELEVCNQLLNFFLLEWTSKGVKLSLAGGNALSTRPKMTVIKIDSYPECFQ